MADPAELLALVQRADGKLVEKLTGKRLDAFQEHTLERFIRANEADGQRPVVRGLTKNGKHVLVVGDGGDALIRRDGSLDVPAPAWVWGA